LRKDVSTLEQALAQSHMDVQDRQRQIDTLTSAVATLSAKVVRLEEENVVLTQRLAHAFSVQQEDCVRTARIKVNLIGRMQSEVDI
jgi:hypothetical protein